MSEGNLSGNGPIGVDPAALVRENEALKTRVAALEAKGALGEITGQIAHEINNLISLMLVHTQAARKAACNDTVRRALDVVVDVSAKLLHLAGSVREFLKGSSSSFCVGSPADALESILRLMEVPFEKAGITVACDLRSHAEIACDIKQLELVYINLLLNAQEALRGVAQPRVTISSYDDEKYLYVQIEDNGCGMSDDVREHAFKPFFTTKTHAEKPAGIGLTVCRDIIVKRHLGSLRLETQPNKGTIFTIVLHKNFDLQPKAIIS